MTQGLLGVGLALPVESALTIHFPLGMVMLHPGDRAVTQAVLVLRALQPVAIGVLTYVTSSDGTGDSRWPALRVERFEQREMG